MTRTLLFLSADSFQACVWKGEETPVMQQFSNDADGRESFSTFLGHHRYPAYLLVDIIEEDFHLETIPHLFGSRRTNLIERKFEQYYRTTPFRQATLLKRQSEGRRDDEFLFSALTNPQRISPWLDTLLAKRIPLVGLYSVPNISAPLVKKFTYEHILLLSWEKSAGLRQTYFKDQRLHFSRLIPITAGSSFSESVAAETPRTRQYLKSLSLPPAGEVLDVHIICHNNDRAELQAKLQPGGRDLKYEYIDIEELARKVNCSHHFTDSDATLLFLNLLATKPAPTHYANSSHTHFFLLWQLRRILFGLTAVTVLSSLLWGGISFWQGREFVADSDPLKMQADRVRQQTQQRQRNFANTSVPSVDMKTSVLLARNLNEYSPDPKEVLYEFSKALDNFPRITVHKLAWQSSPADAAPSPYPAQVITFEGGLTDFGNEHRQALAYLDRFQQALIQHGYTVTAQSLPLDVSSKGSISGDAKTNDGKPAQFTLRIVWRHAS
jgi:hypothetical protein